MRRLKWLLFFSLCTFGVLDHLEDKRLRAKIEVLQDENNLLWAHAPAELLPQREAKEAGFAHIVFWLISGRGAGDEEERSGWPTRLFLLATLLYSFKVWSWLSTELTIFHNLIRKADKNERSNYSLSGFLLYRADYWLSSAPYAKALALGTFTLLVILLGGFMIYMVKGTDMGSSLWDAWIFVVDAAAHADEDSTAERIAALLMTVVGMLIFAILISLISDTLADQLDSLKQGKALVLESQHIVVLGWNDKLIPMLKELALGEESEGGCAIVVLAELEKEDMEREIAQSNLQMRGCVVICRKGNATVLADLEHVSVNTAKAVILLSPVGLNPDEADGFTLQVLLVLKGIGCKANLVVELQDMDNEELISMVGGGQVETVVAHDFIGRLIVQSSRQHGLAQVLEALFGFEGVEFYMKQWPELIGVRFGEILYQFKDAIPMGIITADGSCLLNPDDEYVLGNGELLVVLAEDDDTYSPTMFPYVSVDDLRPFQSGLTRALSHSRFSAGTGSEKILMVGWRRHLGDVLKELNDNMPPGSEITIFSEQYDARSLLRVGLTQPPEPHLDEPADRYRIGTLQNVTIYYVRGNPLSRRELDKLPVDEYTLVFVVHEFRDNEDSAKADGRSLTSLFLLRDIRDRRCRQFNATHGDEQVDHMAIISEVLDPHTRSQLQAAGVQDYVMSNEVVSAALAMVTECRMVNKVLKQLLSAQGCEIYLCNVGEFCPNDTSEMSFFQMMFLVRQLGRILMGYVNDEGLPVLNPADKLAPRVWKPHDRLVVLAQ
eukprot:EG_transcript_3446